MHITGSVVLPRLSVDRSLLVFDEPRRIALGRRLHGQGAVRRLPVVMVDPRRHLPRRTSSNVSRHAWCTESRLKLPKKASANPFDCGLRRGVWQGMSPRARPNGRHRCDVYSGPGGASAARGRNGRG